jgi:hypothetical protein
MYEHQNQLAKPKLSNFIKARAHEDQTLSPKWRRYLHRLCTQSQSQ